jgi:hypothetical protein
MRLKKSTAVNPETPAFLLSAEVRQLLRCSKRTLIRYYRGYRKSDGTRVRPVLASVRRGGAILFARAAVESYLSRRKVVA